MACHLLTCLLACLSCYGNINVLTVLCSQVHRGAITYALRPNSTVVSEVIGCIGGRPNGRYGWNCSDLPDGTYVLVLTYLSAYLPTCLPTYLSAVSPRVTSRHIA